MGKCFYASLYKAKATSKPSEVYYSEKHYSKVENVKTFLTFLRVAFPVSLTQSQAIQCSCMFNVKVHDSTGRKRAHKYGLLGRVARTKKLLLSKKNMSGWLNFANFKLH